MHTAILLTVSFITELTAFVYAPRFSSAYSLRPPLYSVLRHAGDVLDSAYSQTHSSMEYSQLPN